MLTSGKGRRGKKIAIAVSIIVFAMLSAAFLAWIMSLQTNGKNQAHTAIEAAALQAASDIGRIVVSGNFGRVALVDDYPDSPNHSLNNDKRSIQGINTILATRRNALIIAKALGNTSMLYLALQDLKQAHEDAHKLSEAITDAARGVRLASDKNGSPIDLAKNAEKAYNARGPGKSGRQIVPGSIVIQVGQLNVPVVTNIPTPVPASFDPDTDNNDQTTATVSGRRFYKAYVPVNTNLFGKNIPLSFAAVGDSPRLVTNAKLVDLASGMPPAVVRVSLTEKSTTHRLQSGRGDEKVTEVRVAALAQAGGPRLASPAGTLCVSFPQGFPPNHPVDFTSVKSIMNSSMLPAGASASTKSPYAGWMSQGHGNWFRAQGGPVPKNANARLVRAPYRGRYSDSPAVALSFMVYDWITSMGLRPNVAALDKALGEDLRSYFNKHEPGSGTTFTAYDHGFVPPAYADQTDTLQVTSAIFGINEDGAGDPRDLSLWDQDPSAYRQQLINSFSYVPASSTIPANARLVSMTASGDMVTTNGKPITVLHSLWESMKKLQEYARQSFIAANNVAGAKSKEIDQLEFELSRLRSTNEAGISRIESEIKQINALLKVAREKLRRAQITMNNAQYCTSVYIAMIQNQKALTAGGVDKLADNHYMIAGQDFYPPGRAATEEEILGDSPVSTGQSRQCPVTDWCADPNESKSLLQFYKHRAAPAIGKIAPRNGAFMPAALAQDAVPPNQNLIYLFNVCRDASIPETRTDAGSIRLTALPRSPYADMSTLEGQVQYQNRNALRTKGGAADVIWLVQARDNNARGKGTYFANSQADGYDVDPVDWCHRPFYGNDAPGNPGEPCSSLVAEWQIRCPTPLTPAEFCKATTVMRADGTVVGIAHPCPPPPPMHG